MGRSDTYVEFGLGGEFEILYFDVKWQYRFADLISVHPNNVLLNETRNNQGSMLEITVGHWINIE